MDETEPIGEPAGVSEGAVPGTMEGGEGAEQRSEGRYPVFGDAEVFVIGGMSTIRGRVLNLSGSGCYVQTVAWAQLPPETTVEVLLVLPGNVVRALAEARYSESRVGLGLRFVSMELPMRRRLDAYLASLPGPLAERGEEPLEAPGDVGVTAPAGAGSTQQTPASAGGDQAEGTAEPTAGQLIGESSERLLGGVASLRRWLQVV